MITVHALTKQFTNGGHVVQALRDANLELRPGQLATIVGKSGSGKSTLLALLGALDRPTSGTITVDGNDITTWSGTRTTKYRRSTIGFVFQSYNLVPNLSALDNVMLPMEFAHVSSSERKSRAEKLLTKVGLDKTKQQRRPGRLSGGEQQRVAIARALANSPKLILADEPTGNLDTATSRQIIDILRNLAEAEQTTIIVVTHDQELAKHADVHFSLVDGRLHQGA